MARKKPVPQAPISFLARLKQHHLYGVVVTYAVVVGFLIQLVSRAFPYFGWAGAVPTVIVVLLLGFPVVAVLAWLLIEPKGPAQSDSWQRRHWKLSAVVTSIVITLVVISGFYALQFSKVHMPVLQAETTPSTTAPSAATVIPAKSIAVLPFENLSSDKNNQYFADGMQDLILTKLAQIGDLRVISRTSTQQYASHPQNLMQIGSQLGVATILEGSVQKAGNQVLINVQLINVRSDNHIWAETYQRTLDNIFGVEGEVAQQIADALKVKLTGAEQQDLANIPTHNPAAYDAFLKAETLAQQALDAEDASKFAAAEAGYRRAIALDPKFALAYAHLAHTLMVDYWFSGNPTTASLTDAKSAADRALTLAPNSSEAYVALGYYYYWGFFQYRQAIKEFQRALQLTPNNLDAWLGIGAVQRRQGKFEAALATFRQAVSLAPRDRVLLDEYGDTYAKLRQYPEAQQQLEQSLAIDPDYSDAKDVLVQILLFGFGNVQGARAIINPPPEWRTGGAGAGELYGLIGVRAYPDLFDRKFDAAFHDMDSAPTRTWEQRLYRDVAHIAIQVVAGRQASVQSECRQVKTLLDAKLAKQPDSIQYLVQASWADACLGRDRDAIAAARRAAKLVPISQDAYSGPVFLAGLAQIEAHAGQPGKAIRLIRKLMAMPAGDAVSIERLKLDPVWDPLRKTPAFQALLKKYAQYKPAPAATSAAVATTP